MKAMLGALDNIVHFVLDLRCEEFFCHLMLFFLNLWHEWRETEEHEVDILIYIYAKCNLLDKTVQK